jgi:hypothetical protein
MLTTFSTFILVLDIVGTVFFFVDPVYKRLPLIITVINLVRIWILEPVCMLIAELNHIGNSDFNNVAVIAFCLSLINLVNTFRTPADQRVSGGILAHLLHEVPNVYLWYLFLVLIGVLK